MSTIAILYPGEVGTVMAERLQAAGHRTITCLAGRSARTRRAATAAGIGMGASLAATLRAADAVLSCVPVAAAADVARACAAAGRWEDRGHPILYIDMNSVGPGTMEEIGVVLQGTAFRCIDSVLVGPASRIGQGSVLLLSGRHTGEAGMLLEGAVDTMAVGAAIGDASMMKMALALVTKSVAALTVEMAVAMERNGHLAELERVLHRFHPHILAFMQRNLPTYARHADRRVDELEEVCGWLTGCGVAPLMAEATLHVIRRVAANELPPATDWRAVVRALAGTSAPGTPARPAGGIPSGTDPPP